MNMKKWKYYILFVLLLLVGYVARELTKEFSCPRCNKNSITQYAREWQDLRCDSCGYHFPVEEHNTLGITYYKINNEQLKEDINHYQRL